ncbi:MFS transporter [Mesorhizobium sp. KR2-14]|uniref:MFS transporter n=1 Tax=Mesorhizobium sp. KR2-14 TaxID=3156610 RepID=UPI0032B48426
MDQSGSPRNAVSEGSAPGIFLSIALLTLSLSALVQFLWQGTVLFMREAGQPSQLIGLVYLAGFPWLLRFLWAPLIDRYGSRRWGHFRSWIIATQIAITFGLLFLTAVDPLASPYALLALLAVLSAIMGTQQSAILGLMAARLAEKDRSKGMTVKATAFAAAGVLMGAGILYWLGDYGWTITTAAIFVFGLFGLAVLLPLKLDAGNAPPPSSVNLRNQFAVLWRPGPRRLLLISLGVNGAVATTYGLQSIMLIDAGLAVSQAALITMVVAAAVGAFGALSARYLVERFGGYMAAGVLGLVLGASCLGFATLLARALDKNAVVALVLVISFLSFGLIPATKSILLGYCSEGRKATDVSVFSGVEALAFMVMVTGSSAVADLIGFAPIVAAAGCVSIMGGMFALRQRRETVPLRAAASAA